MADEPELPLPRPRCMCCWDYGYIEIYDDHDVVIRTQPCPNLDDPALHPPCGVCEACQWTKKHGALDEVTGRLSRPACTGPPPDVTVVESLHHPSCDRSDRPDCCPPF